MRRILVVRLDLGVARRDVGDLVLGVEALDLHLALLLHRFERRRRGGRRRDRRCADRLQHLAAGELLAQALREGLRRMPSAVRVSRLTLPSGLRSGAYSGSLLNARISRSSLTPRCSLSAATRATRSRTTPSSACPSSPASRTASDRGWASGVVPARRDRAAQRPARPASPSGRLPWQRSAGRRSMKPAVALDAEEDERRENKQHQHELQHARVSAKEIEHGRAQTARKANRGSPFVEEAGILAERLRPAAGRGHRMVGAEGLEPPTYAL